MTLFNFKKKRRCLLDKEFKTYLIIRDWIAEFTTYGKTFVTFEITKRGVLNIYSNYPGVMIGKAGERVDRYAKRLKEEIGFKKVNLYEHKNIVSNFGIGTWER